MRKVALIISIVCNIAVQAQHITKQNYAFADETQLWRLTGNAAGLSLDSAQARGVAIVDYSHRSGDFHRVQEGSQTNNLELFTERYQKIASSSIWDVPRTEPGAMLSEPTRVIPLFRAAV